MERLVDAAQDAESVAAFYKTALQIVAEGMGSPFGMIEVNHPSYVLQEDHADPPSQRTFWQAIGARTMEQALRTGLPEAQLFGRRGSDKGVTLLSVPVSSPSVSGAVVLVRPARAREAAYSDLGRLSAWMSLVSSLVDALPTFSAHAKNADKTVDELSRVAPFASTTELAFTITNRLRTRWNCDQITLASVSGPAVELLAISGLDEISTESPGVRLVRDALEEALDFRAPVVHPRPEGDAVDGLLTGKLHERWSDGAGCASVATIPLTARGQTVALLGLRRSAGQPFTEAEIDEYRKLVEPYAAALGLVERATRGLRAHAATAFRAWLTDLLAPGGRVRRLLIGVATLFALWLFFGSVRHEVTVSCVLAPSGGRQLSAPFDGRLRILHVSPGDRVVEGDLLCEFDDTQLRLEEARLTSELAVLDLEHSSALAEGAPAELQLAAAKQAQLRSNLRLVRHKIHYSALRAPVSGTVVSGNLDQRIGDVFSKGEPLFHVADDSGWDLELAIPEREIGDVALGQEGRFASLARPELKHAFVLSRIAPGAEDRDGQNVFVGVASTESHEPWMRPGLEGYAVLDVGERSPLTGFFGGLRAWLRLHLFL